MANSRDRVLIVESDPVISDLIGRQALQSAGYQVFVAGDASTAIAKALQWAPDLVIANLNLPGLSGKDLMVALASQGIKTPVIILGQKGMESDLIQTFRLGASDYLMLPVREAEVISAAERALKQVHDRRERERLGQQLQQANQELQARVRELTTIFAVGKAVTSVTEQTTLLEKILDGALRLTQADLGWFLLRDDADQSFVVAAERGLPASLGVRVGQTWDDGISSLVAMSGEPLSIHGDPMKRFKIQVLGLAALIVPIKVQQKKVIGLLVMMRKQANAFGNSEQHLLDALADYASISLANARVFRQAEERARSLQQVANAAQMDEKRSRELIENVKKEIQTSADAGLAALDKLAKDPTARWRPDQRQFLTTLQEQLTGMQQVFTSASLDQLQKATKEENTHTVMGDQMRQAIQKMQPLSQKNGCSVLPNIPSEPIAVCVESGLVDQVLDGFLSNMIRFSNPGALISLRLEKNTDYAHVLIRSSGFSIEPKEMEKMFDQTRPRAGAMNMRLDVVKEVITGANGKIWVEGQIGKEVTAHFTLPLAR